MMVNWGGGGGLSEICFKIVLMFFFKIDYVGIKLKIFLYLCYIIMNNDYWLTNWIIY